MRAKLSEILRVKSALKASVPEEYAVLDDFLPILGIAKQASFVRLESQPEAMSTTPGIVPDNASADAKTDDSAHEMQVLYSGNIRQSRAYCLCSSYQTYIELHRVFEQHSNISLLEISEHPAETFQRLVDNNEIVICDIAYTFEKSEFELTEEKSHVIDVWMAPSNSKSFRGFLERSEYPQKVCFTEMPGEDQKVFVEGLAGQIAALTTGKHQKPELSEYEAFPLVNKYREPLPAPDIAPNQSGYWIQDNLARSRTLNQPDTQKALRLLEQAKPCIPLPKRMMKTISDRVFLLVDMQDNAQLLQADITQLKRRILNAYPNSQLSVFYFYGSPLSNKQIQSQLMLSPHNTSIIVYSWMGWRASAECFLSQTTKAWRNWCSTIKAQKHTVICPVPTAIQQLPATIQQVIHFSLPLTPYQYGEQNSYFVDIRQALTKEQVLAAMEQSARDKQREDHLRALKSCPNDVLNLASAMSFASEFSLALLRQIRRHLYPDSGLQLELKLMESEILIHAYSASMMIHPDYAGKLREHYSHPKVSIGQLSEMIAEFRRRSGSSELLMLQDSVINQDEPSTNIDATFYSLLKAMDSEPDRRNMLSNWCMQLYRRHPEFVAQSSAFESCVAFASHQVNSSLAIDIRMKPQHQWVSGGSKNQTSSALIKLRCVVYGNKATFEWVPNSTTIIPQGSLIELQGSTPLALEIEELGGKPKLFRTLNERQAFQIPLTGPAFPLMVKSTLSQHILCHTAEIAIIYHEENAIDAQRFVRLIQILELEAVLLSEEFYQLRKIPTRFFKAHIWLVSRELLSTISHTFCREWMAGSDAGDNSHIAFCIDLNMQEYLSEYGADSVFFDALQVIPHKVALNNLTSEDKESTIKQWSQQIAKLVDSGPVTQRPSAHTILESAHLNRTTVMANFAEHTEISDEMQYVFTLEGMQIQVHEDEMDLHHHHPETLRKMPEPGAETELAILEQLDPNHWVGSARIALARKPQVVQFLDALAVGKSLPVDSITPLAEDTFSVNLGLISAVMYEVDHVGDTQSGDQVQQNVMVLDIDADDAFIRVGNRQLQEGYGEQANRYHGSIVQCKIQQMTSSGEADVLLDETMPGILRYEDLAWGYNNLMVQHILQEGQRQDMYCLEVDAANRPIMSLKHVTADSFEKATEKLETGAVFDMMPILIEETGIVFYYEKLQVAGLLETDELPLIHQLDSVFMLEQLNKRTLPVKLTHIVPGNEQLMFSPANWVEDALQEFRNTYKEGDRIQGTVISAEEQIGYVKLADHVLGQLKGEFRGLAPNLDFSIGSTIELEIDRIDDDKQLVHVNIHSEYLFNS